MAELPFRSPIGSQIGSLSGSQIGSQIGSLDAARRPVATSLRPPRALPLRKARAAAECEQLEQLPNIGPSLAADLRGLGVVHPTELKQHEAYALYCALCTRTGKRHDPCVLDTFIAAVDFMRGAEPRPWWLYTAQRKLDHPGI